jgi:hypothetical protein
MGQMHEFFIGKGRNVAPRLWNRGFHDRNLHHFGGVPCHSEIGRAAVRKGTGREGKPDFEEANEQGRKERQRILFSGALWPSRLTSQ